MRTALTLLLLAAILSGCVTFATPAPTAPGATLAPTPTRAPVTPLPTWGATVAAPTAAPDAPPVQVFFTAPGGVDNASRDLEAALIADIEAAARSVDMAMYNFSLGRVADALIAAQRRGVRVRVVTDSDALDGEQLGRLQAAGIGVIGDRRESLMHDKFLVIDRQVVWSGSLNLTGSGTYNDNNNFTRIASPQLAENYSAEFEEMFTADQFGNGSPANTPNPRVTLPGGVELENYFSPDDGVSDRLVELVESAHSQVDFLAYSFTSDPIADALLERAREGVAVRGVFDENMYRSNTGGEYLRLRRAQMDVRLDANQGLMHHKVIILDGETVIFGSYNFTRAAERSNDENVIIIHDRNVAALYELEFEKIYNQAAP